MSDLIETGKNCSACETGHIVAEIISIPLAHFTQIPISPASQNYYQKSIHFWCRDCGIVYRFLPGDPESAERILEEYLKKSKEREDFLSRLPKLE